MWRFSSIVTRLWHMCNVWQERITFQFKSVQMHMCCVLACPLRLLSTLHVMIIKK